MNHILPKEILRATTQRDTVSYYPKRYWELLPKEILGCLMGKWSLQGGDGGACKLLGDVIEVLGCFLEILGVADALAARDVDRSMNGDDSHNSGTGVRRQAPLAHECTYPDFIKCKPLYFKGTKGVVELTHCLKNETVSRYKQLTDVGHDVAYAMTWTNLKKMMTDKYCPRGEIKKLEVEMWNLKVKGTYVHSCSRQARLRGKLDNINQAQQQPPKKQGVAIAYTAGSSKRKEYAGTLPLCNKCKFHHNGQCTVKCANSKRVGHLTRGLRIPALTNNQRNLTCNELESRHYKK
ncbi:hypothetical protein Tco_1499869 [Tanacetum coccineum]